MIDDLLIEFDEMGFAPTTVCPNVDEYAIEWREKVRAEFKRIQSENAELKARIGKAVELPFIHKFFIRDLHDNLLPLYQLVYLDGDGSIATDIENDKQRAEAKLAVLICNI